MVWYIKGKNENRQCSILHDFFQGLCFFFSKTNVWYCVCTECWWRFCVFSVLYIYIFVLKKKKCAMHFLPWEIIFMWSIYRDWVYHNLFQLCYAVVQHIFCISIDKLLIGTMRSPTDISFWQMGPRKKKNMISIFDPHMGPLANIRISRMGAGHNQEQPNPLTTLHGHGGLKRLLPRCLTVCSSKLVLFHVIIGFKHDLACIVSGATRTRQCTRRYAPRALTILVASSFLRSHNARYIMLKSLIITCWQTEMYI